MLGYIVVNTNENKRVKEMTLIRTYDKESLVAAFTSAMASDSDTWIIHERESGITELFINGETRSLAGAVSIENHNRQVLASRSSLNNFNPVTDKEIAKIHKRVLRDRKRAVAKMKRAAIKVLCG